MRLPRELELPLACAAVVAGLIAALSLIQALRPAPENEMETVERLLTFHGLPVDGFAATAPVNLEAIDVMAAAECSEILRKAYLAKLAVLRMAPDHAGDAAKIGHAIRFTLAEESGVPECAP